VLFNFRSPVFFLTFANLFGAAIGFMSGMLTARWLDAGAYGVLGVLAAINSTALNFVDLRLQDVMAKLYFRKDLQNSSEQADFRASLIQSSLICYGGLSFFFLLLGTVANFLLPKFFTETEIRWTWILASAAGMSITYFINPIGQILRLTGRFRLLGWRSMAGSVLSSGIMVFCVYLNKDLNGYYLGFILSNCAGAVFAISVALVVWVKLDKLPILRKLDLSALKAIRGQSRFLMWGNLLGYIKLGHRSADVLLVGYFCDDNMTGLYKFARMLTDKLNMFFDSMNQVYFPTYMQMLSQGAFTAYRRLATKMLFAVLVFTAVVLAAEYLLLPHFVTLVLKGKFAGVEPLILIMTVPFFFGAGMYIWMWPLVLHFNLAGRFTFFCGLAVLCQYGLGVALFAVSDKVESFPAGYLGYYVLMVFLTGIMVHGKIPAAVPFPRGSRKGEE
jgi:O-antigen/teichoic acid export membrane protein